MRELTIYNVPFSRDEFKSLKFMTNLTKIDIENCRNFGDQEIVGMSNCPNLKQIRLVGTGVSFKSTDVLSAIPSSTNVIVEGSTLKGS